YLSTEQSSARQNARFSVSYGNEERACCAGAPPCAGPQKADGELREVIDRRFSETCSSPSIFRFPPRIQAGQPVFGAVFRGFLYMRAGSRRSANRFYGAARAGQGRGAQSHQAARSRSGSKQAPPVESAVVHRDQSPAFGNVGSLHGAGERSGAHVPAVRRALIFILRFYKSWISPFLPSACRFYPTCSDYMREAVERYGVIHGTWRGIRRLARCHPFHEGGIDPVR